MAFERLHSWQSLIDLTLVRVLEYDEIWDEESGEVRKLLLNDEDDDLLDEEGNVSYRFQTEYYGSEEEIRTNDVNIMDATMIDNHGFEEETKHALPKDEEEQ